jgi:MFS superfamily sulfate permease-like transporter
VRTLGQTNLTSVLLGSVALVILLLGKTLFKHRPVALLVLVGSIVVAGTLHLDARGVKLLGDVPRGLPVPAVPHVSRADLDALLPLALACFLLAAVETSAIGRMFSDTHGYRFDATQEFLAIGSANLVAGLGAGLPVSGGSSQSLVNESAGARTPVSGLIATLITLVVTLFLAGLLRDLPQPALAAIVLAAITGLVDVHALRAIWRFSREEFAVAMAALIGVLGSGLLNGVLIGVALSILLLIRRAAHPRIVEIGRVPGTTYFASLARHPENERIADVLVVRPEGSILYFNVDHVRDRLAALITGMTSTPRLVILMMSNVPFVDFAGAALLIEAQHTLGTHGIALHLADARTEVSDALRRKDAQAIEFARANQTVTDILAAAGRR